MNYEERLGVFPLVVPVLIGAFAVGSALYKGYAGATALSRAGEYAAAAEKERLEVERLLPVAQREAEQTAQAQKGLLGMKSEGTGELVGIGIALSVAAVAAFFAFRS